MTIPIRIWGAPKWGGTARSRSAHFSRLDRPDLGWRPRARPVRVAIQIAVRAVRRPGAAHPLRVAANRFRQQSGCVSAARRCPALRRCRARADRTPERCRPSLRFDPGQGSLTSWDARKARRPRQPPRMGRSAAAMHANRACSSRRGLPVCRGPWHPSCCSDAWNDQRSQLGISAATDRELARARHGEARCERGANPAVGVPSCCRAAPRSPRACPLLSLSRAARRAGASIMHLPTSP